MSYDWQEELDYVPISSGKNAGCQIIHLYEYEISGNVNDILITNMKIDNGTKSRASVFPLHNLDPKDLFYMYYCDLSFAIT
jgi:hypothetical protein